MVSLYFSYSYKDQLLRDEMEVRLSELKREGIIDEWFDSRVPSGLQNEETTNLYFDTADIILLMVRPYFIASDSKYNQEMEKAIRKHEKGEARVIPVILDPCNWTGALPCEPSMNMISEKSDGSYDIFHEITKAICTAVEEVKCSSFSEPELDMKE